MSETQNIPMTCNDPHCPHQGQPHVHADWNQMTVPRTGRVGPASAAWRAAWELRAGDAQAMAVTRSGARPAGSHFLIEYDAPRHVLRIDGVDVSVQVFETFLVAPNPDPHVWYRFVREDDVVTVHTMVAPEPGRTP